MHTSFSMGGEISMAAIPYVLSHMKEQRSTQCLMKKKNQTRAVKNKLSVSDARRKRQVVSDSELEEDGFIVHKENGSQCLFSQTIQEGARLPRSDA